MSEADFWQEIKKAIGHRGHWDRIESHATADGFPDTKFTCDGITALIELKQEDEDMPTIRPSQVRWFRREARNGGNCWLFSKIDNIYMLHQGRAVTSIYDQELEYWAFTAYRVWENKVDWNELIEVLKEG